MAEIEIGYVGEIEQSWGRGFGNGRARDGRNDFRRARNELDTPRIDVAPTQVVCDHCFLYYWAPLGACPEC